MAEEGCRQERMGEEQEQAQVEPSELRRQKTFLIFWVCGVVTAFEYFFFPTVRYEGRLGPQLGTGEMKYAHRRGE